MSRLILCPYGASKSSNPGYNPGAAALAIIATSHRPRREDLVGQPPWVGVASQVPWPRVGWLGWRPVLAPRTNRATLGSAQPLSLLSGVPHAVEVGQLWLWCHTQSQGLPEAPKLSAVAGFFSTMAMALPPIVLPPIPNTNHD